MSTQRRESRWQRRSCMERVGFAEQVRPAPVAWYARANANGGTAPPVATARFHPTDGDLSVGSPAWLATNSLQLDYRIGKLVRPVRFVIQAIRRGSPPFGAGARAATGTPATYASSLPHIASPSGLERLHPTLPRVPAALSRWTERYDGKRDLYLQYAA
jgi:hypothetical protein